MDVHYEGEPRMWVSELFDFFARSHMTDIMYYLDQVSDGPTRFGELRDQLDASPNTLSQRLKDLVDAGLVSRTAYDENPPRVEYEITEKAMGLVPAFAHFHDWCMKNTLFPESTEADAADPA